MPLSATELVFGRFERKPDAKAGAIRPGGKIDFSAMTLANDSVADNQSEAGSRATLGGEERDGKNMRLGFRRNAAAVIGDFDEEVGTVTPGPNVDPSSSVHRIDGIVDEVGPHLIKLAAVGADLRQGAVKVARDGGVFQFVTQDNQRILNSLVDIDLLPRRLIHERIGFHGINQF